MKIFYRTLLVLILLMSLSPKVFSQLDNSGLFYDLRDSDSLEVGDLSFDIYTLGFNKNNEYYEKTATGYTFFGYLVRPEISYTIHEGFSIKMGAIARKDFGNLDYTLFQPTFLMQFDYSRFKFLFGTINGPLEHNYIEPLYDFERIVTNNPENGLQILYKSKFFNSDTWISWNKMIYDRSPFREELSGGMNINLKVIEKEKFQFAIPLQFIATHVGGQIDDAPEPARTVTNFALGIDVGKGFKSKFFKGIRLQSYVVNFQSLESDNLILPPYKDGFAYYANLTFKTHIGSVMVSYWNGDEFSSWNGGHLYQSTSKNWREPFALENEREVIIVRFLNDIKLRNGLRIVPRFEPYWNLNSGQFGFSFGTYIKFQDSFHIANLKKAK